MVKIVFLALAGLLTFAYSALGFVALFGMDLTGGLIRDLLLLWPLLAFPVFLLILISLRWAVLAMWLLIFCAWGRCCEFNTSLWIHRLPESPADSALFVAVVLVTLSYIISALGGNLPSDGVAGNTRR
jgi:hypothetical protein